MPRPTTTRARPEPLADPLRSDGPALIAYRLTSSYVLPIVPAAHRRDWMDAIPERFAYRCLPLLIANEAGWWVTSDRRVRAVWHGGDDVTDVEIVCDGRPPNPVASHFGSGIITWAIPYLFRTSPGYVLLARGPSNSPKDGVYPLEGIVETDWAVASFTMNWKLTRPGLVVTFEAGEPICMVVPQRQKELEEFEPRIRDIADDPALHEASDAWAHSRTLFLLRAKFRGRTADGSWQKHYFRGTGPSGVAATFHQQKLRLRPFRDTTEGSRMA